MPSPKSPTLFTRLMLAPMGMPARYVYREAESGDWYAILRAFRKGYEDAGEAHYTPQTGWYLERDQNNIPVLRINQREVFGALLAGKPQCPRCGCCSVEVCACDEDGIHTGPYRAVCFPYPFTLAAALALEEATDDPDADPDAEDEDDTDVA